MKKIFISFIFILGIIGCGERSVNTRSYYFPYADFFNQKIYKYVDAGDPSKILYWHFNTEIINGDTIFSAGVYNKQFILTSVFINRISDEGAELKEMYVNLGDTNTLYKCEVKSGEVFNWKAKDKVPLFVSYAISNSDKTETEEVVTERMFDKKKESATYQGKEYKCLIVKENTLINHIKINRTQTEEQKRKSFFAQGIGLIKFETYNADASTNTFNLESILTLEEWKATVPQKLDSLTGAIN